MATTARQGLRDLTNALELPQSPSRKRSRQQAEEDDDCMPSQPTKNSTITVPSSNLNPSVLLDIPRIASNQHRRGGTQRMMRHSRQALSFGGVIPVSTRPILESFVSSETNDTYSFDPESGLSTSCAYSHASQSGIKQLLAVGCERGYIDILDTSKRDSSETSPPPVSFGGVNLDAIVFDVQWRKDDKQIAAAGDIVTIYDVETTSTICRFSGHTAAAKSLAWDPSNDSLVASGGRDGNICLWDLRLHTGAYDAPAAPAMVIKQAHNPEARRKRNVPNSTSKSVTSLLYLPDSSHHLVTAGSGDGILLKWDLRSARDAKQAFEESFEDPTVAYTSSRRPRGITSIALGTNDGMIYGLGTDGIVHSYLTRTLQACPSLPSPSSTVASLQFTYKLATSPCGRWLATGSADGRAYLYDILSHHTAHEQAPVALHGHKEHVMGLNWANSEVLATYSYDLNLRVWRADADQATRCRAAKASNRRDWKWAGGSDDVDV